MNKTAEQCVQAILQNIERRTSVDFGDKNSVRRYNTAMDRIYEDGRYIDTYYPERINLLVDLLHHKELKVILTIAGLIQKLKNATEEDKLNAIAVVKDLLTKDVLTPAERLGCAINVETWEKEVFGE